MNNIQDSSESLSRKLRRIANLYTAALANSLADFNINRYFDILIIIAEHHERPTQKKLAEIMHVDKSRMAAILSYLSQKGHVHIEKNPNDRREHFISLTDMGKASIPLIRSAIMETDSLIKTGLNESDFNTCLVTLSTIEQNLRGSF